MSTLKFCLVVPSLICVIATIDPFHRGELQTPISNAKNGGIAPCGLTDKEVFQSFKILRTTIQNLPSDYRKILFYLYDADLQASSDKMGIQGFPATKKGEVVGPEVALELNNDAFEYQGGGRYSNLELSKKQIRMLTQGAQGLPSYQYILFTPYRRPNDPGIYYTAFAVDETTTAAQPVVFTLYGNNITITSFRTSIYRANLDPSPPAKPCDGDCD